MQSYHIVWLKANRVEPQFLMQAMENGFEIHHVDGDHSNDTPSNLVLIWGKDHQKLHLGGATLKQPPKEWKDMEEYFVERLHKGKAAYELRSTGMKWVHIASKVGCDMPNTCHLAKNYARCNELPWPVPTPVGTSQRNGRWSGHLKKSK